MQKICTATRQLLHAPIINTPLANLYKYASVIYTSTVVLIKNVMYGKI